jgi:hypothetical protein
MTTENREQTPEDKLADIDTLHELWAWMRAFPELVKHVDMKKLADTITRCARVIEEAKRDERKPSAAEGAD